MKKVLLFMVLLILVAPKKSEAASSCRVEGDVSVATTVSENQVKAELDAGVLESVMFFGLNNNPSEGVHSSLAESEHLVIEIGCSPVAILLHKPVQDLQKIAIQVMRPLQVVIQVMKPIADLIQWHQQVRLALICEI